MKKVNMFDFATSKWKEKEVEKTPLGTIFPEKVTPEQAEIFMRYNWNRSKKISKINQMKRDLLSGNFGPTNDMIGFGFNRELFNGQNRLQACIDSGIPIWVFVGYGFTKEDQSRMDNGTKRTLHDTITLLGGLELNPFETKIARFTRGETIDGNIPKRATRAEEVEFAQRHYDFIVAAGSLFDGGALKKKDRTSVKIGSDWVSAFFRGLEFYKDDKNAIEQIKRFSNALICESASCELSRLHDILGKPIVERNRALLFRKFKQYLEDCSVLYRRKGQDQGGRTAKYKMTERYIQAFVNPSEELMSRGLKICDGKEPELFMFPEEIAS